MGEQPRFLVICGSEGSYWQRVLRDVLCEIGTFRIEPVEAGIELLMAEHFDLVVVDSGAVNNMPVIVARIKSQRPDVAVVVASDSADWMKARKAFQAGATDFVWKSFDPEKLSIAIQTALTTTKRVM